MKTYILFLLFLLGKLSSTAQCNYQTFLNVSMGSSLYDCYNTLQLNKSTSEVTKNPYQKYWDSPSYLKGDSVYKTQIDFNLKNPCSGLKEEIEGHYYFVDDKLYFVSIKIHISKPEYETGLALYEKFISDVRKENQLKFEFPFETISKEYSTKAKEKIGEGIRFYSSEIASKDCKLSYSSISIYQEYNWDRDRQIHTDIKEYIIQLEIINLKSIKLTCKGY